jgi:multiple sugar transport system substrate-binding protein
MALAWPPTHTYEAKTQETADAANDSSVIRWAELPGSSAVYHASSGNWEQRAADEPQRIPLLAAAGRLGSVTRESSRSKAALHVLAILSAEESRNVAAASPAATLYRRRHLATPADWYPATGNEEETKSYAEAAEQSLSRGVWMFSPRIPGRERYLAALDDAVRKALAKELSARNALTQAAEKWDAITEDLGREKQLAAYRRSLGLEP